MSDVDKDQEISDQEIKAFFEADKQLTMPDVDQQRNAIIRRNKANVAQRDTILFAFVKLWTTLAEILAPLFASFMANRFSPTKPTQINKQTKNIK